MIEQMKEWHWYVYIIECQDGLYYTGMTSNLPQRFDQHASGLGSKFTTKHGFKELKYHEEFTNIEEARLREVQLKDWSRKKKEALWSNQKDSRLERSSRSNNKLSVVLVAHDIRSTHNVGAFFRTCDGLGVEKIIFSGYTPYPTLEDDTRLPHFSDKITRQIHKTALGAESTVDFERYDQLDQALQKLKQEDTVLVALEQFPGSINPEECAKQLKKAYKNRPVALIVGNEIHGVKDEILKQMDLIMEIPMHGTKESLNVSVATAIALYALAKPASSTND